MPRDVDLDAEVQLTYLRYQMTFTGSLPLSVDVGEDAQRQA